MAVSIARYAVRLAELAVRVPDLGGGEARRFFLDLRAGLAAAGTGAEEMVEVERLDRVVRANAVARRFGAETRSFGCFVSQITAMTVRSFDECVVLGLRNDVIEIGHVEKR